MRITWILGAFLALSPIAAGEDITVYLQRDGAMTLHPSVTIAGSLLQKAGIAVTWRGDLPRDVPAGKWIRVDLADRTPLNLFPGALAVAHPYAGCSKAITVFVDRVRSMARRPDREPILLAYVLVHEIAHVLQGVDRHSDAGIMRANWTSADCEAIYARRLEFLEEDLIMIRQGVAKNWCRPSEPPTHPSGSGISVHPD
jgi:hypothetical protein